MKWLLSVLAILLILSLSACGASEQDLDNAYQGGFARGYKAGEQLGYRSGFYDGCVEGYYEGIYYYEYEKPIGLAPSMDWFYMKYPQYR